MLQLDIKSILINKNKTQYWLAKETGIAPNAINKIYNCETTNIRFDTLEKICIALECSPNELFKSSNIRMQSLIQKIK